MKPLNSNFKLMKKIETLAILKNIAVAIGQWFMMKGFIS